MYKKRKLIFVLMLSSLGISVAVSFSHTKADLSKITPQIMLWSFVALILFILQWILFTSPEQQKSDDIETRIDMVNAKNWAMDMLSAQGYTPDMSLQSLGDVDRFLNEYVSTENQGRVFFGLGIYVGEVLIAYSGGIWEIKDLPTGVEIAVVFGDVRLNPVQRVAEKYKNGEDDSLLTYISDILSNQ